MKRLDFIKALISLPVVGKAIADTVMIKKNELKDTPDSYTAPIWVRKSSSSPYYKQQPIKEVKVPEYTKTHGPSG